jgi:ERF superfamily
MGAALTYARRYALLTLVGITGEDDLDAPDLVAPTARSRGSGKPRGDKSHRFNGSQPHSDSRRPTRHNGGNIWRMAAQTLAPDTSAQLRDRLLTELTRLADGDEAALWAQRSLPDKQTHRN